MKQVTDGIDSLAGKQICDARTNAFDVFDGRGEFQHARDLPLNYAQEQASKEYQDHNRAAREGLGVQYATFCPLRLPLRANQKAFSRCLNERCA